MASGRKKITGRKSTKIAIRRRMKLKQRKLALALVKKVSELEAEITDTVHLDLDDVVASYTSAAPPSPTPPPPPIKIKGRRVLTIESINSIIQKSSEHSIQCGRSDVKIINEVRHGIQTVFRLSCSCGYIFEADSDLGRGPNEANDALIWGVRSSGTSFCTAKVVMEEILEVKCDDFD